MAGCGHESEQQPKPTFVVWRTVWSWTGHGDYQSESFNESGEWRIKWETHNEKPPGTGRFKVTVSSAVSGRSILVPIDHKGEGHNIAYIRDEPRPYYLVIDSSNIDWSVTVEEPGISTKQPTAE